MPNDEQGRKGQHTIVELAHLGPGATTAPTAVTFALAAAAAEGDLTLSIPDPGADIPKGSILIDPAGNRIITKADFAAGAAGNISVERLVGLTGKGIPAVIASGATIYWSGMRHDTGADSADYSDNESRSQQQSVVFNSSTGGGIIDTNLDGIAPAISRGGLLPSDDSLVAYIGDFPLDDNFWIRLTKLNNDGSFFFYRQGYGAVTQRNEGTNAQEIDTLSYEFLARTEMGRIYTDVV